MAQPTLFIFAGLPGAGKTTLARMLAARLHAVFLRIDTVEQGLRDLCACQVQGEGYRLSYRIAADNLRIGNPVVADSCNPIELTRREWRDVAVASGAPWANIEVLCSDPAVHERRVASRRSDIPNLCLPDWRAVLEREYHPWSADRLVIDTAGKSIPESFHELLAGLESRGFSVPA